MLIGCSDPMEMSGSMQIYLNSTKSVKQFIQRV